MQSETTVNFEALGQTFHQEFAEFRKEFDEVRNLVDSLTREERATTQNGRLIQRNKFSELMRRQAAMQSKVHAWTFRAGWRRPA
jgi:hypothetical protein